MARPRKTLPPGSRDMLLALAKSGTLKESHAAAHLGISLAEFRRLLKNNEDAAELWAECLAVERDELLDKLHTLAKGGDRAAIQFLLAARHGMSDKAPEKGPGDRVQIVFQLPGAMTAEQYQKAVTIPQAMIEAAGE
jgi:hypothetical protein